MSIRSNGHLATAVLAVGAISVLGTGFADLARADVPLTTTLISDVAEKVTPAVVNITTRKARVAQTMPFDNPMFREWLGPEQRSMPKEIGAGSGVIISADGYIVTNNHVIEDADEITVALTDKREFTAKLIGTDKPSDIALIKIDASSLPFLTLGDSTNLRLGEIVLAIGNPFAVGQTVTMGIVSAKGRTPHIGSIAYEDFIQTDASINPGNSGGALVNLKGELVGINTAILSPSRSAAGVGFAVPSNMVKPIRDQIIEHGRVRRGWLGVAIQDITPELARSLKLGETKGVLISDVLEGGPAAKAKIQPGDVVTRVEERSTSSASELRNMVAMMKPGSKVRLAVLREGKKLDLTVALAEKEDERVAQSEEHESEQKLLSGVAVEELSRDIRQHLGVPGKIDGVIVSRVEPDSPAERSGIVKGDIITSVDQQEVHTVSDFAKSVSKKDSREVLLRVWRSTGHGDGMFTFIVLRR